MTERVQTALLNIQLTKHWTEFSFHEQIRIPGSSVARGEYELLRIGAAVMGIYGNSEQEAMYPVYGVDAEGKKLNGANVYTLHFAPGQLPSTLSGR
jgi:hypothetical protein